MRHDSLEEMEQTFERVGPERIAAVFMEPVIGAGGVYPPAPGYIEGVAELCQRTGALLVIDAVICAFGRLGTWFGIERWGVEPDMIVFAKGVTSGYLPLGGVMISERIAEPFWGEPGGPIFRHGSTYAGHPTCCAAALANIALLERDGLIERGREQEQALLDALAPLAEHEFVSEVRGGVGMMAAVELTAELCDRQPRVTAALALGARAAGVFVRPGGTCVAVSPPLTARVGALRDDRAGDRVRAQARREDARLAAHRRRRHGRLERTDQDFVTAGRIASIRCGPGSAMARARAPPSSFGRVDAPRGDPEPSAEVDEIEVRIPQVEQRPGLLARHPAPPMRRELGIEDRVATVVEDHDGDVELFARHRPERLDRVESRAVGLERDDRAGPDTRSPPRPRPAAPGRSRRRSA